MDDLAAFLTARLDEDEARARAALEEWHDEGTRHEWEDLPDASFAHARSFDPARVLREVEAKRAILDYENYRKSLPGCLLLRHFAAVYSDHPGYRPEWKP